MKINGTEYKFQKLPPREWLRLRKRSKDEKGMLDEEKLYDELCEHVIVEPRITIDDFTDIDEMEEVMAAAVTFCTTPGKTKTK